jgi:hypothetical protein
MIRNGRVCLNTPAWKLVMLASKEHNAKYYFAAPVERVYRECGIDPCDLPSVICDLELDGFCEFRGILQGVLVLLLKKRAMIGLGEKFFDPEEHEQVLGREAA